REWGHRSSVWVNQELAILAYRQFFEGRKIPILAFKDPQVKLEGAMTSLIVNPRALGSADSVVEAVRPWLASANFAAVSETAFEEKWAQLSDADRMIAAALIEEGGREVKEATIRTTAMRLFGMSATAAGEALQNARLVFMNTDLIKFIHNVHS